MVLNTGEMRSNGIKVAFFFQRIAQRLGASPQTPKASGGWRIRPQTPVCDTFELHQLTQHDSKVRLWHFLIISLSLPL